MTTTFFRLLQAPIDEKGAALAGRVASYNTAGAATDAFTVEPGEFGQIPGSPFAYWASDRLRSAFASEATLAKLGLTVQHGLSTKNDFRWLRLFWEVPPGDHYKRWFPLAKGGAFACYYADLHLLVDTRDGFAALEEELLQKYPYLGANAGWVLHPESSYLVPGLTYTRRTTLPLSVRALPAQAYFSDKGPACIGKESLLKPLLAILNSRPFGFFVELQMGAATAAARSYEVGVVQNIPIPEYKDSEQHSELAALAIEAHDLQRERDTTDETSHAFCLPAFVGHRGLPTLQAASAALDSEEAQPQARLAAIQSEIDDIVFDLYGLSEADREVIARRAASETAGAQPANSTDGVEDAEPEGEAEEEAVAPQDPAGRVQDLLMWCVGVAFGRWDARKALDPSLLPPLGGPFDPLPRYAPGALVEWPDTGVDDSYPLPLPDDGILVDDPNHPSDIVRRVRLVLAALWGERADAIEAEACTILGIKALRDYFRDPRRFFAYHIKRYSKSRRKAPIYWLLQSERRNYGVWLHYHRIDKLTLYTAGRDYVDAKIALEKALLQDLRAGLPSLAGAARAAREREVERQEKLAAEVTAFGETLDRIALLNLPPDPNDGVLISIAPLHPLVPWSEAGRMWNALQAGQYAWSTMAQQLKSR